MNTITTNCLGITITHPATSKVGASIVSAMKESDTAENKAFNAAVDGLESLILAHFCAGIDVTTAAYLEGIETAYDAIANNIKGEAEDASDENIVTIQKTRRVNAIVDEVIEYEVSKADWEAALEEHANEDAALFELQRELKVKRTSYEAEIDEINEEFEVDVIVL